MRTLKLEIGQPMIERLGVQIHHVPVATFVLCMAVLTVVRQVLIQVSVITLPLFDIRLDILMVMTGEASSRLTRLLQGFVATLALLFELCVAFNHRPRHQQQIELAGYSR